MDFGTCPLPYGNIIGLSAKTCNIHLYADNTVMYVVAPTADQAMLDLHSDFVAWQKDLADSKLALNAGQTECMMFSCSHRNISDGLHTYACKYQGILIYRNRSRLSLNSHYTKTLGYSVP